MKIKYTIEKKSPNTWLVKGDKWEGCYCNKEPFEVVITSERRPSKADILGVI